MTVDSSGGAAIAHLRAVRVGRDYGATIEILGGIAEGVTVITNPSTDLSDGMRVRVVAAPPTPPPTR
jgi:hypothetical protein